MNNNNNDNDVNEELIFFDKSEKKIEESENCFIDNTSIKEINEKILDIEESIEKSKKMLKTEKGRLGSFKGQITELEKGILKYNNLIDKAKNILDFDIKAFIKNASDKNVENLDKTYNFVPDDKILNCLFLYSSLIQIKFSDNAAYWKMISFALYSYLNPNLNKKIDDDDEDNEFKQRKKRG